MPKNPLTGEEFDLKYLGEQPMLPPVSQIIPRLRAQVSALSEALKAAGAPQHVVDAILEEAEEPFR